MTPPPTATATLHTTPEPQVFKLTRRQWRRAAEAQLQDLGLTYRELKEQAGRGNFVSTAARQLWYMIGGTL